VCTQHDNLAKDVRERNMGECDQVVGTWGDGDEIYMRKIGRFNNIVSFWAA